MKHLTSINYWWTDIDNNWLNLVASMLYCEFIFKYLFDPYLSHISFVSTKQNELIKVISFFNQTINC